MPWPDDDDRLYGLGGGGGGTSTVTPVSYPGVLTDYYTDIWELMIAMKHNMRTYLEDTPDLKAYPGIKSWGIGYVFKETIRPAVSLFPISKVFLGARGGGQVPVEYTVSIDSYSNSRVNIDDAKRFTFSAVDETKRVIKRGIKMRDNIGHSHAYSTRVSDQSIFESMDATDKVFSTSASMDVICGAYHQMNVDRITESRVKECTYDFFFDKVIELAKKEAQYLGIGIKRWVTHTAKESPVSPTIYVLPGDEEVLEEYSNGYVTLQRPVQFHVVSSGYPKAQLLKENIKLTDRLVTAIEKNYMVEGYAQQFAVESIRYGAPGEGGFTFGSTITVLYKSKMKYDSVYN